MTSNDEIVTMLRDLKDKVDLLQRDQASIRSDIVEHILDILKQKWNDEAARRRERCWR